MQARRSNDSGFRSPFLAGNGSVRHSSDRRALMQDYDVENQFELGDLVEDSDETEVGHKRTSFDEGTRIQNGLAGNGSLRVKKETVRSNSKGSDR